MSVEWFRNTTWNATIEQDFNTRLARSRRKGPYLRTQAFTLERVRPDVALDLLDRYFALPDEFERAMALESRGHALAALGRTDEAMESYERALKREAAADGSLSSSYLELPLLIATARVRTGYGRALDVLHAHKHRVRLIVDEFRWHAARALLAADSGEPEWAQHHADQALEAAQRRHSGVQHHPKFGLVPPRHDELVETLRGLAAAAVPLARSVAPRTRGGDPSWERSPYPGGEEAFPETPVVWVHPGQREHEALLAERQRRLAAVVEDLRHNGSPELTDFSQLFAPPFRKAAPFPNALPTLLSYLTGPHPDDTRFAVAVALEVPETHQFWAELVAAYRNEKSDQIRDRVAYILRFAASRRPLEDLIALVKDRSLGSSRLAFIRPLSRTRDPRGLQTLQQLEGDPDLVKELAAVQKLIARRKVRRERA